MPLDLGLTDRRALVCGSSSGLGRACAEALLNSGASVFINGRDLPRLQTTADDIERALGKRPSLAVGDVTTAEGRAAIRQACPEPDILITNGAGPPPGNFMAWSTEDWQAAVGNNMIAPIMLIKDHLPSMQSRGWGRIINITSSTTKAPLPLLGLSNGARSGLTGFVAGLAREVAGSGVTINNLLPGRFLTGRLRSYIDKVAESQGVDADEATRRLTAANPMKRFGDPAEFGAFCAFLASAQAAFMTGQNILLDGGEYPGL
jgi:3-oxoacyl-[acyl-carrier protein] reductase